ncbi:hypothetical protein [Legionella sp. 16cNR16C]|uniref:hypothetical protein n=1 Tax=Legionella sp. 16cNR16C TaxID=2905656 RepID=UPI001E419C93|nr:hypothetical protein [Legionella sp. 16cNR16C]MCE3045252.1 hypothetical protein [Legionella sp. 16cNR16C]
MVNLVKLSDKTRRYIQQMNEVNQGVNYFPQEFAEEKLPLSLLLPWLKSNPVADKKQQLILEQVQAALLKDIYQILHTEVREKVKKSKWAKFKFILLFVSGTLYFICEGFDGISNVLGLFSIPTAAVFVASLVFSAISILLFYGLDLSALAKEFGIKMRQVPQLTSVYAKQVKLIHAIQAKLAEIYDETENLCVLQDYLTLSQVLQLKFAELDEARAILRARRSSTASKALKLLAVSLQAITVFSGAFCAGQTVSMFIAGWVLASVSPTFWPVLLTSILVGACALVCYWYSTKPEIEELVGRQLGLDEEVINLLCDEEAVSQQKAQLEKLEGRLMKKLLTLEKREEPLLNSDVRMPIRINRITRTLSNSSFFSNQEPQASSTLKLEAPVSQELQCI